jgi:hypothetical protein
VVVAFRRHTCCRSTTASTPYSRPSASDAFVSSSLFATPLDLPVPAGRRRSLGETQVQALSDRLFSSRHRRGSNRRGQAPSPRRDFLRWLIAAVPYKATPSSDNGTHFSTPGNASSAAPDIKAALDAEETVWAYAFEYACAQNDIDHRLVKRSNATKDASEAPAFVRRAHKSGIPVRTDRRLWG